MTECVVFTVHLMSGVKQQLFTARRYTRAVDLSSSSEFVVRGLQIWPMAHYNIVPMELQMYVKK